MTFAANYEKLFRDIGFELSDADGCSEESLLDVERRLQMRLPPALRDYYAKAGNHPINQAHNRLLSLSKLDFDGNHLVFLEENQSVAFWSIDISTPPTDDPIVFQGESGKPIRWTSEELTLSAFFELCVYWQAACGGLEFAGSASELDASIVALLEQNWSNVRTHNRMRFFAKPGQVLVLNDDGEGLYSLLAAGTSLEQFEAIDDHLGIDWDWSIIDELEVEDCDDEEDSSES
jgi:hypothetical protein